MTGKRKRRILSDLLAVGGATAAALAASANYDIYEKMAGYLHRFEGMHLDEIVTVGLPTLAAGLTWFGFRRWREARSAYAEIQKSEEKYRALIENTNEAIMVAQDNKFKFANKAGERLLGEPLEKIVGKSFGEYIHPDDRSKVEDRHRRRMRGEDAPSSYSFKVVDRSGRIRWVRLNVAPFVWEKRPATLCFLNDISDIRQAMGRLAKSEDRYRSILESIEEGYIEVDLKGNIAFFNSSACRIFGLDEKGIKGLNLRSMTDYENKIRGIDKFNEVYRTGIPEKSFSWEITHKSGGKKTLSASISLIKDRHSKGTGFRSVIRDVTKEKMYEQELRKALIEADVANQAKSAFLANMSHEIRTPLNAIIGFAELLMDTGIDDSQREYIGLMQKSGNHLLDIINDILDISKIEAGEFTLEEMDFDPELMAYDVCEIIKPRTAQGVDILCRVGDEVPPFVKGDPGRYRQVLMNLMGNAAKFTKEGSIELGLDVGRSKGDGSDEGGDDAGKIMLHAYVKDSGTGIKEESIDKIFETFKQADTSTTRRYGGTGLGLSISREIAGLMGGRLYAESRYGEGSTFNFTSSLKKSGRKKPGRKKRMGLENLKVLAVDDNPSNLKLVGSMLEKEGIEAILVDDPKKAEAELEIAQRMGQPVDVVLTDMQMPEISGYDLARHIRGSGKEYSDVRIIACSSEMLKDYKECRELRFDGYINKPLKRESLYDMIETVMTGEKSETTRTKHSVKEEIKHSASILVAEDNPVNQKLISKVLENAGYSVRIAENGKKAVEIYSGSPELYDIILMDVQMPEMDGLSATQALRKMGHRIPIIAMTAHAMKEDEKMCLDAGMDGYISKPIKREIVYSVLERHVLDKQAMD